MGDRSASISSVIDARGAGSKRYRAVAAAVQALRRGELVAMPTETVYGLAADACNPRAVGKVFIAKGRPRFNPLILHVHSAPAAHDLGVFNEDAEKLAEAFWPGPLTLVLPLKPCRVPSLRPGMGCTARNASIIFRPVTSASNSR